MQDEITGVLSNFCFEGQLKGCELYGAGHINHSYLVCTDKKKYILQNISENIFKDIDGLMENISSVCSFLRAKNPDPRCSMHVVRTVDGKNWVRNQYGCWRAYEFIEGTICLQAPESDADFYESALAFGKFISDLADFPAETLHETIKNFHNTPDRYRIFKETLGADPLGRAKGINREIDFVLSMEEEMSVLQQMRDEAYLPLRVTHNDTKLNNVLLDAKTRKALCVVDLDTVMPGLSAYDFGDAIRFGAATGAEDEKNLDKISINLHLYEVFAGGFVTASRGISKDEKSSLPLGAKIITMENGVRFLTDYIDGDHYYTIHRPEHNLDRARTQFKMTMEMGKYWDEMRRIIDRI